MKKRGKMENKANSHFDFDRYRILAKSKRSQVWVETVIYIVIGLTILGTVLAVVTPVINRYKDKIVIEQTITALNNFNEKLLEVRDKGLGNKRIVEFRIKKGYLTIDGLEDKIVYILEETGLEYSEPEQEIGHGDIKIKTEKKGRKYNINLILSHKDINITYGGEDEKKKFSSASIPYKLFLENLGGEKTNINIIEGS